MTGMPEVYPHLKLPRVNIKIRGEQFLYRFNSYILVASLS